MSKLAVFASQLSCPQALRWACVTVSASCRMRDLPRFIATFRQDCERTVEEKVSTHFLPVSPIFPRVFALSIRIGANDSHCFLPCKVLATDFLRSRKSLSLLSNSRFIFSKPLRATIRPPLLQGSGGQTFSAEGHIANFIATGVHAYYTYICFKNSNKTFYIS